MRVSRRRAGSRRRNIDCCYSWDRLEGLLSVEMEFGAVEKDPVNFHVTTIVGDAFHLGPALNVGLHTLHFVSSRTSREGRQIEDVDRLVLLFAANRFGECEP